MARSPSEQTPLLPTPGDHIITDPQTQRGQQHNNNSAPLTLHFRTALSCLVLFLLACAAVAIVFPGFLLLDYLYPT